MDTGAGWAYQRQSKSSYLQSFSEQKMRAINDQMALASGCSLQKK
jgi:hypothetical protein